MATLAQLATLYGRESNDVNELVDKIMAAVLIKAEAVRAETPQPTDYLNRLAWVREAFIDPRKAANNIYGAILAASAEFTPVQITGASDVSIQSAVDVAVESFLLLPNPGVTPNTPTA